MGNKVLVAENADHLLEKFGGKPSFREITPEGLYLGQDGARNKLQDEEKLEDEKENKVIVLAPEEKTEAKLGAGAQSLKGGGRNHPPTQGMKKGSSGAGRALHFLSWRLDLQFKKSEKVKTKVKQRKSMKQNAGF